MSVVAAALTVSGTARAAENDVPSTTEELERRLTQVLSANKVPGMGLVVVDRTGIRWATGIGAADVAAKRTASADTIFRIASISKMFVGLSALKLFEDGKLEENVTLRSLAPEIPFDNPWESTDPVRIVHLLEHTAGWSDYRVRVFADNDPTPKSLMAGLSFEPRSQVSRWRPGSHAAYTSHGYAAVARVVENVSGQVFEDYVAHTFLLPMGMSSASYFPTADTERRLTRLYHDDGVREIAYHHHILRPGGALNVSARDMGALLELLIGRGVFRGTRILSQSSIERMERHTSTPGAREGLSFGFGLGNAAEIDAQGRAWFGHTGGIPGSSSDLKYLPTEGVGYFFSLNARGEGAFDPIAELLQRYLTRDLAPVPLLKPLAVPIESQQYAGWYERVCPRWPEQAVLDPFLSLFRLEASSSELRFVPLAGQRSTRVALSPTLFRRPHSAIPTFALVGEREGAMTVQFGGTNTGTYRRVPAPWVWLRLAGLAATVLAMVSSTLFALAWLPGLALRRRGSRTHLPLRLFPLLGVASLAVTGFLSSRLFADDGVPRFGHVTPWSLALFLASLLVPVSAIASWAAIALVRRSTARPPRAVLAWSIFVTCALTAASLFLARAGAVGYASWR